MQIEEILGKEEFNSQLNSKKPIIVDFKASWCSPCKMQTEILADFIELVGDKVKVLKVDVDENSDIAKEYDINVVPTILLINNKKVESKKTGITPINVLSNMVIKYL